MKRIIQESLIEAFENVITEIQQNQAREEEEIFGDTRNESLAQKLGDKLGIMSSKEKGHVKNQASEISDIPGNWDHKKSTFSDQGWKELHTALKGNEKHFKYAKKKYGDPNKQK